jgi:hypothetical protein
VVETYSRITFLRFDFAAASWTSLPVALEPVKLTRRTSRCEERVEPVGVPKPERMFTTPGGKPDLWINSASFRDYSN